MTMAVFEHATSMYSVMDETAVSEEVNNIPLRIWRGSIVDAYKTIGASQHYYTKVMDTLKHLGCITILSTGRRGKPSVLALHHAPDETEFIIFSESRLTNSPEAAKLRTRLETLERRIGGLDIGQMLVELDSRVSQLEHLIREAQEFPNTQEKE